MYCCFTSYLDKETEAQRAGQRRRCCEEPRRGCGAEEAVVDGGLDVWRAADPDMGQKEAVGKAPSKRPRAGPGLGRSSVRIRENWVHVLALLFDWQGDLASHFLFCA